MPHLRLPPHAVTKTFALAAATAALIAVSLAEGSARPTAQGPAPLTSVTTADPQQATLAHCNTLGTAAEDDPACKAAWSQLRAHFFTPPATPLQFKRPAQWVRVVRPDAQT